MTRTLESRALSRLKSATRFYVSMHAQSLPATPAVLRRPHSSKAWVALSEAERRAHLLAYFTAIETARRAEPEPEPTNDPPAPEPAKVQTAAFVVCAGQCGALIPSLSTYKPSLRFCSRRRGQAACSATTQDTEALAL